jgi:DNA-binding NarL/FixJ family response regulator
MTPLPGPLTGAPAGVGYLLKDRVADVSDFVEAISRIARAGTMLDPEVVQQLIGASRRTVRAHPPRTRREPLAVPGSRVMRVFSRSFISRPPILIPLG